MDKFTARPYKLFNKIQHYDWGTKNGDAFIPKFLGIKPEENLPYAELWIGAHPKAPSEIEIDGNFQPLNSVIEKYKNECMGEYVSKKFNGKFPFLLKILSAGQALSIQAHPNKTQAKKLHDLDPENYPDANHKPEIAIAIDSLEAIAGFRPADEIINNLKSFPELLNFVDVQISEKIFNAEGGDKNIYIKEFYSAMMTLADDHEKLSVCILNIMDRLKNKNSLGSLERAFVEQNRNSGNDVGLFSFLFFNYVKLNPGQAIYTGAGVPHAYLKGNIVECMANSDNVVRAGLTNKFKDVRTLLDIIRFDFGKYPVLNSEEFNDEVVYKTPAEEFEVISFIKKEGFEKSYLNDNKPIVFLIMDGSINICWYYENKEENLIFQKGESFFIPASLPKYKLSSISDSAFFTVTIP